MKKISASLTIIRFVLSLLSLVSAASEVRSHAEELSESLKTTTSQTMDSLKMHVTVPRYVAMVVGKGDGHIRGTLEAGQASTSVTLCGTPGAKVLLTIKTVNGVLRNAHDESEDGIEYSVYMGEIAMDGESLAGEGYSTPMTIPPEGRLSANMLVEWDPSLSNLHPGVYQDTVTVEVVLEN